MDGSVGNTELGAVDALFQFKARMVHQSRANAVSATDISHLDKGRRRSSVLDSKQMHLVKAAAIRVDKLHKKTPVQRQGSVRAAYQTSQINLAQASSIYYTRSKANSNRSRKSTKKSSPRRDKGNVAVVQTSFINKSRLANETTSKE